MFKSYWQMRFICKICRTNMSSDNALVCKNCGTMSLDVDKETSRRVTNFLAIRMKRVWKPKWSKPWRMEWQVHRDDWDTFTKDHKATKSLNKEDFLNI